jgi:hypothetical protein
MRKSSLSERVARGVRDTDLEEEAEEPFPTFEDTIFPDICD